jgi:hypothetical protein
MDWQDYQEEAADIFRGLGCFTEVDKVIQGARVDHKVDVWVVFTKFGFETKWIIECKYWNSNVPKEKVLALKSIVDDIGADRGIIISKTGFQSGAIRASNRTNITLTNIEDLKETVKDDLLESTLHHLQNKATHLKYHLHDLYETEKTGPNSLVSKPLPGVDGNEVMKATGRLSLLDLGFDRIRLNDPPYPVAYNDENNKIISTPTIESFVDQATFLIHEIENLLETQLMNIKRKEQDEDA